MSENFSENQWQQITDLFNSIADLPSAERASALAKISDPHLRAEVGALLAADTGDDSFLQMSPMQLVNSTDTRIPSNIGKYKILHEIGRGGMGAVYLATREDFKNKVAVKIIKRGMDTDEILRRFQTERQILANLEHPNIARLIDGGVSDDGLSFLVMEYVAGEDLLTYGENHSPSLTQKLKIFRKICAAVGYAHRNLVVHRDLKPSNIIVSVDGEPKLLDFGISKLLTDENADTGTATSLGMMTPNYASPEQFRGETVSTATDIYSLGVILFELLTGELPYRIRSKRFEEAARIIAETEPIKPSLVENSKFKIQDSRFKTENAEAAGSYKFQTNSSESKVQIPKTRDQIQKTSSKQNTQNAKLLRGDLDNIILKALRKEPARRYATVEQFSEDIRRHLDGLPVTARPDTFSYRAEKFVKRNFAAVSAAAAVFLILLAAVAGISWQYVRAERQRISAEKRFGEVRQLANNVVFKYHDEIASLQGATKVRAMLITDALQYLDSLAQETGGDVSLQTELGQAYLRIGNIQGGAYQGNTGDTAAAVESYRKSLALFENAAQKSQSDDNLQAQLAEAHKKLGLALRKTGDKQAGEHFQTAVAINEKLLAAQPNDNARKIQTAQAYVNLCRVMPKGLAANESVETCRRALPLLESVSAETPNDKAVLSEMQTTQNILGIQFGMMADAVDKETETAKAQEFYARAADYFREAAKNADKLVIIEPANAIYRRQVFGTRLNESTARLNSGESGEALQIQQNLLEKARQESAADRENAQAQQDVASTLSQIGLTQIERKEFPAAYASFRQSVELLEKLIGQDAANKELQQDCFNNLIYSGDALKGQNDHGAAVKTYRAAFDFAQKAAKLKDTPFAKFAEGWSHEKIGESLMTEAERAAAPSEKRGKYLAAREEFEKAAALWQDEETAPENFGLSEDLTAATQKKSAECQSKAAL